MSKAPGDKTAFEVLDGIPRVDFPPNLQLALSEGRRMGAILGEVVSLRIGPGKLTPNEYFYYRLWSPLLTSGDRRRFVGKQAQGPMHFTCNNAGWHAAAADKVLFHTLMTGAGLPVPPLLAHTGTRRRIPGVRTLNTGKEIAAFLRSPAHYPLFAKPVDGKYSLSVYSADAYDRTADRVMQPGEDPASPDALAEVMGRWPAGYLLQRRLAPAQSLQLLFGPRLWSVRAGTQIPFWSQLIGLVQEAASLLTGLRTQSWDVALTDQGPVLLEVNFGGDLNLPQLATGAGVLDDVFGSHLRSCGYRI